MFALSLPIISGIITAILIITITRAPAGYIDISPAHTIALTLFTGFTIVGYPIGHAIDHQLIAQPLGLLFAIPILIKAAVHIYRLVEDEGSIKNHLSKKARRHHLIQLILSAIITGVLLFVAFTGTLIFW